MGQSGRPSSQSRSLAGGRFSQKDAAVLLQVAPEERCSEPASRREPYSAGERTFGTLRSCEMWVERTGCDSKALLLWFTPQLVPA
ncbi:hypothetical protein Q8A67_024633 [Cirrhinus molitorella]|uniref:Uncharacterized protein n=1 Tax=Cirrhinus molitorella TaxID=172907 RepID=A0AA88T9L8_9TELE|nr:hypothetical protein Q8A67_024633 [Cirrhinus molitorella]